jgi:Glycosyl transferase family 2
VRQADLISGRCHGDLEVTRTGLAPTVSVVIPAFNAARTLGACLDSVYGQTFPIHEVIVVDDGSTDRTADVARRYSCTLIEGDHNRGVSAARNAGIAAATGDILFFLDSDEALTQDSVANAVEILESAPDCGCVHGLIAPDPLFDDGPIERYRTLHNHFWLARGIGELETAFFAQAAVPRRVFDRIGGFDEALRDSEDLEFSDRLAPHYTIILTDRVQARHDEEHRLGPLLAEKFRRAKLLVPALVAARLRGRTNLTANSLPSVAAAAFTLGMLLVSLLLLVVPPPVPGWVPPGMTGFGFLGFCLVNAGLLRFVARQRGPVFVPFFVVVHFLVHCALLAGAAIGGLRMLKLRRLLTFAIVVAALVGVALVAGSEGPAAARAFGRVEAIPLAVASILSNIAGLLLAVQAWRVLIPGEHPIRGLLAARIYFLGLLSKYLPGRVWGVATHVAEGRAVGVPGAQMASAYLLSLALTILTGTAVGLLAAPAVLPGAWLWLGLPVAFFLACVLWPALVVRPIAAVITVFGKHVGAPPNGSVRRAILLAVASWLASGLHLWFLVLALDAPALSALGPAVGAFALATVVSSLAVIVPDGWGVRELTIAGALVTVLPDGASATAAIASRVVCVLAELGSSAAVVTWARLRSTPMGETRVQP